MYFHEAQIQTFILVRRVHFLATTAPAVLDFIKIDVQ